MEEVQQMYNVEELGGLYLTLPPPLNLQWGIFPSIATRKFMSQLPNNCLTLLSLLLSWSYLTSNSLISVKSNLQRLTWNNKSFLLGEYETRCTRISVLQSVTYKRDLIMMTRFQLNRQDGDLLPTSFDFCFLVIDSPLKQVMDCIGGINSNMLLFPQIKFVVEKIMEFLPVPLSFPLPSEPSLYSHFRRLFLQYEIDLLAQNEDPNMFDFFYQAISNI